MADGKISYTIGLDLDELNKGTAKVNQQFQSIGAEATKVGNDIDSSFKKVGQGIAAYFAVDKILDFANSIKNVRAEIQSLEISFEVLLGSKEKADALFNEMRTFASSTPMQLKDLAGAAQTMLGFGIAAEEVMPMLKAIGDVSMADTQKFQSLSLAFSQVSSSGKLMGQDLMQMINAGFNPLNEISKQTGKSISELKDEMSKGAISAEMVADAFKSATSEGGQFYGMLDKQSQGIKGAISNMESAWNDALNAMGESGEGLFVDITNVATEALKHWDKLAGVILTAAAAYGTYKAALMATTAYQSIMATSIGATTTATTFWTAATRAATTAMQSLKAAVASNPLGLLLAALTTVIGLFVTFKKKTDEAAQITEKFGQAADKATTRVKTLYSIIEASTASSKTHEKAVNELKEIYEDYGIIADKEKVTLQELIDKRNELTEAIRNESAERERANQLQAASDKHIENMNELWGDFEEEFSENMGNGIRTVMQTVFNEEVLGELSKFYKEWNEMEYEQAVGRSAMWTDEQKKRYDKLSSIMEAYKKRAIAALQELGLTQKEIDKVMEEAYGRQARRNEGYIGQLLEEEVHYGKVQGAVNSAADAMSNWEDANVRAAYQNKLNKMSAEELNNEIDALIVKVNSTPELAIWVKAYYDDSNLPDWLQGVKNMSTKDAVYYANLNRQNKGTWKPGEKQKRWNPITKRYEMFTEEQYDQAGAAFAVQASKGKTSTKPKSSPSSSSKPKKSSSHKSGTHSKKSSTGHKRTKAGRSSSSTTTKADPKEIAQDVKDIRDQVLEDVNRLNEELSVEIAEGVTSAMEEGRAKELAEIEDTKKAELKALEERKKDLRKAIIEANKDIWEKENPNAKNYQYTLTDDKAFDEFMKRYPEVKKQYDATLNAIESRGEQIEKEAKTASDKIRKEELEEQSKASIEFLKQWGDYEAKKAAITADYEAQIKKATTPSEAANLRMQLDKELKDLERTNLEETIDWNGVFSELEGHTKEYLQGLVEQLQKVIKEGTLPPDQLAVAQEKLREINAEISKQNGLFQFVGDRQREHTRLVQAEADAREVLKKRQEAEAEAEEALLAAQEAILGVDGDFGEIMEKFMTFVEALGEDVDFGEISSKLDDTILQFFEKGTPEYKQMVSLLETLRVSEAKLAQARKETKKATTDAKNAEDAAKRESAQKIADWFADTQQFITQNSIDEVPGFLDSLGLGDASEKASKGLSAFNNAAGAAADFASGNYLGAAMKGFNALMDFGDMLGIGGSSDKTLIKDIERLTASNEALRYAVDALTEEMQKSSTADALTLYQKITDDINKSMANTQEMMSRSAAAYDSGKLGFIGGTRSSNYRIDEKVTASQWARVSQITGASVKGAADFFNLTSEQMYKVAKEAPEIYGLIKSLADDGYQDAAQFMDEYIEYWRQLEEAQQSYYEKMSGTTFDSIVDDFTNALLDMDSTASDFSKNFERYMQQAIINGMVSGKYQEALKKWYESFAQAMENGMTEAERNSLRNTWDEIVKMGIEERNALKDTFGWSGTSSQEGSKRGFATASQDSIDELNGRFTAVQMSTHNIEEMLSNHIVNMDEVRRSEEGRSQQMSEMTNLIIIANNNLETIAKNTKELYGIREDIASIKRNTDRL